MKKLGLAALSMMIVCAACAPAGSQYGAAIVAGSDGWETAFNAGDVDALVALYTDDARLLPPNAELAQGSAAIALEFGGMIASGVGIGLDTIDAQIAGDIGYRVGSYTIIAPDGSVVDRGKYVETWRLTNGEWKISNDVWNSDMPAAGSGTTMIITHQVKDGEKWLAAFKPPVNRQEMFAQHGVSSVRNFQNPDDPNLTGVLLEIEDMDSFADFMESSEVAVAKAEDGVKDATLKAFAEVK
jgi:ketosteroid isomerase-like protein